MMKTHDEEADLNAGDTWNQFHGKSVFLTGHTGFKGSWLALWLNQMGAEVTGYGLDPFPGPNNFTACGIASVLRSDVRADVRDAEKLTDAVRTAEPDVIFHLAAQSLVQKSLASPRESFEINVIGTSSLLDAVRSRGGPCVVVVVTSDKCYRNDGLPWGFRENDPLGGHDPYSASKAACEIIVESYRSSYFPVDQLDQHGVKLVSVRAGNVIGGGDWAVDRIVPDAVRALSAGNDLIVRNPGSTRPWQHVLEPLSGYLTLAARLADDTGHLVGPWNFGPLTTEEASVGDLATALVSRWGSGRWVTTETPKRDVEAKTLRLSIDKAWSQLGWRPRWSFTETVDRTVDWYRSFYDSNGTRSRDHSLADIAAYLKA